VKTLAIVGTLMAGVAIASAAGAQPGGAPPPTMPSLPAPDAEADGPLSKDPNAPPAEPVAPSTGVPQSAPAPGAASSSAASGAPQRVSPGAASSSTASPPRERAVIGVAGPSQVAPERLPVAPESREAHEVVGRLELGYRGVFVTNPGYNPFSTQDYFSGASLVVSRTVLSDAAFSFAPGLAWDYGAAAATARGDHASLMVHRLSVPLEGRLHAGAVGYFFVRFAPGVASEHIEVSESSAPTNLTKTQWLFATDASAGYAVPVVPIPPRHGRAFRMWIVGDGGYSWVADEHVTPASTVPAGGTPMVNQVDLGFLGLRGAFFRVAVAASY
jgi:hypothetical protein